MGNLLMVAGVGTVGIVVYSTQFSLGEAIPVMTVGVLVAAASMLVGGLLGFLFGIPRTLQSQESPAAGEEPQYRANTNLEQISDWLTKILVGVGLVQLGKAGSALGSLGDRLGPGLGAQASSPTVGITIMVTFSIIGFLLSFLWTRIYLRGAFQAADVETIAQGVIDKQQSSDARALGLVNRILSPVPGGPQISQDELTEAIKAASAATNVQIFERARRYRRENDDLQDPQKLAAMERAIPIFRALIAADTENRFHRNHGQLAYALKDKKPPDYAAAIDELTKAIEIRGDPKSHGYWLYELNRAVCRIMLDQQFNQDPRAPSTPDQRKLIVDDLRVTAQFGASILQGQPLIQEWLQVNQVKPEELGLPPDPQGGGVDGQTST